MQVVQITSKEQLNDFTAGQKHSQFLQSWQWGEFHKEVSGQVWRIGIEDGGKLIAAATIIKKTLPANKSYFYCPRGPVMETGNLEPEICDSLFNEIKSLAQDEGAMFLRFDPLCPISPPDLYSGGQANFKFPVSKTLDVQPCKTLRLSLAKTEKELLAKMRQKTRYNIRLAERKGVKIVAGGADRVEKFWELLSRTGERDNFRLHGRDYYEAMIKLDSSFVKLFFAEYKKKAIAANIVSFFGDTAVYMHGASADEERNVMAPYLLQWHTIKLAKELGYKYYDFFGIDEEKWPGVTRFKKGFSGQCVNYPGTYDLIFDQSWYSVYKMIRRVRRTF